MTVAVDGRTATTDLGTCTVGRAVGQGSCPFDCGNGLQVDPPDPAYLDLECPNAAFAVVGTCMETATVSGSISCADGGRADGG